MSVALVAAASLTASLLISTALAQDPPDPSITSIMVSEITMTTAKVTVNLADATDGTTVYLKYGPVNKYSTNPKPPAYNVGNRAGEDRWLYAYDDADSLQSDAQGGTATFYLPDSALPEDRLAHDIQPLWASYEVLVEASLDVTFPSLDVVTGTFITLPPKARGVWVDAEKTALGIQTSLSNLSGIPHTVYYRWRAVGSSTWNTGTLLVPWGNPETSGHRVMTGLVSHTPYEMEVSLDPNFPEDETEKMTAWTRMPSVVRMGVRKVTGTEATPTAVIDHPNGKEYYFSCQSQTKRSNPEDTDQWSYARDRHLVNGYVGSSLLPSLAADSDYEYQCRLTADHGEFDSGDSSTPLRDKHLHTLDDTDTALTEISATLSGTSATISVDLVNTDGTNNDVYLRHREYPSEEWDPGVPKATTTATAQWLTPLTDDTVHEFEASLDQSFPETETLTLFLTVGNPPYDTVANSSGNSNSGSTPPEETTTTPEETTNTPEETNNPPVDDQSLRRPILRRLTTTTVARSRRATAAVAVEAAASAAARRPATRRPNSGTALATCAPFPRIAKRACWSANLSWRGTRRTTTSTFSLRGDDAEPFTIDEETGQILVGPEAVLDYEALNVHLVTLVVTDPGGEETTTELEIHLTDVKLPGKADIFDGANNHNEMLEREEVEAAGAAYGLGLISKLEVLFIVKYYYDTMLPDVDFENLPSMTDKYDLNEDSIIDRDEVLAAMQDFLEGRLTRSDLQQIVKVYYTNIEEQAQEAETA